MSNLKQEMRQKFEKHSSMAFYENNSSFEEGLLEKIMNLAYANLSPFSNRCWSITAVKSPVMLQKLYKAANEKRIAESAIALIICGGVDQAAESLSEQETHHQNDGEYAPPHENDQRDLEMLALSIGYAAKYYCIDYFMVKVFDREPVSREFTLNRQHPAIAIICLGCFTDKLPSYIPSIKNHYFDTIRFL